MSAHDEQLFATQLIETYRKAKLPAAIVDNQFQLILQSSTPGTNILSLDRQIEHVKKNYNIALVQNEVEKNGIFQTENAAGLFAGHDLTICAIGSSLHRYLVQPAFVADQGTALYPQGVSKALSSFDYQYRKPISTLFSAISALTQAVQAQRNENGAERVLAYLQLMNQQTYLLLRAFEWTMKYTSLANGLSPPRFEPLDLTAFLRQLFVAIQEFTEPLGIPVYYELPEKSLVLQSDRQLLSHVILNVLSNACRFTREGNEIAAKVSVISRAVHITISDRGIGIAPDILAHVFEPYYSYNPMGSPVSSMGLGLSIAKLSIEQLGGSIALTSELGAGTTVSFSFPLETAGSPPVHILRSPLTEYLDNRFSLVQIAFADCAENPSIPT